MSATDFDIDFNKRPGAWEISSETDEEDGYSIWIDENLEPGLKYGAWLNVCKISDFNEKFMDQYARLIAQAPAMMKLLEDLASPNCECCSLDQLGQFRAEAQAVLDQIAWGKK